MTAPSWGPADGPLGPLDQALRECAAGRFSGALHVIGAPGGMICLADGAVTAIETPWSPSPEVILLRSGRVSSADWETAFTAAALARQPMSAELVRRGLVGAGELEAVLRTALADAMFALAAGFVDTCRAETGAVDLELPLVPGTGADWLLTEALRRMRALAAFPGPPPGARERVTAVAATIAPGDVPAEGRDEVLTLVDGRRSIRDLAFARGRGSPCPVIGRPGRCCSSCPRLSATSPAPARARWTTRPARSRSLRPSAPSPCSSASPNSGRRRPRPARGCWSAEPSERASPFGGAGSFAEVNRRGKGTGQQA